MAATAAGVGVPAGALEGMEMVYEQCTPPGVAELVTQVTDTILGLTPASCAMACATACSAAGLDANAAGLSAVRSIEPDSLAGAEEPPGG